MNFLLEVWIINKEEMLNGSVMQVPQRNYQSKPSICTSSKVYSMYCLTALFHFCSDLLKNVLRVVSSTASCLAQVWCLQDLSSVCLTEDPRLAWLYSVSEICFKLFAKKACEVGWEQEEHLARCGMNWQLVVNWTWWAWVFQGSVSVIHTTTGNIWTALWEVPCLHHS